MGVSTRQGCLVITSPGRGVAGLGQGLCRHELAEGKGLKIINTDHKRDKSTAIDQMISQLCALLPDPGPAERWLATIRTAKP